ncbi:hypothetical protein [uncultured Sulfitobacter sp.]|uniref:hypothetical protein n=1 Tax=uncultured Sulfitobacter sp. TaxID=191468 RepID=UPI00262CA8FF|nr:hypothetical protein [uncultured Sulfitobacter sp.]
MDKTILTLWLASPFLITFLLFALVGLGGFLASRFINVQAQYRRVTHYALLGLIYCAFTIFLIGFGFLPAAAEKGLFVPMFIGLALIFPLYGVALYYVSAARSNDITSDTSLAWLGFIPIADLWLIFKKGQQRENRIWLEHGVRDIFILAAAVIPFFAGNEILDELGEISFQQRTLLAFEKRASTLEDATFYAALEYKRSPKAYWLRGAQLKEATAVGGILRLSYKVPEIVVKHYDEDAVRERAQSFCKSRRNKAFMAKGGEISLTIAKPDGSTLEQFNISPSNCAV